MFFTKIVVSLRLDLVYWVKFRRLMKRMRTLIPKIKVKKLCDGAVLPSYAHVSDAGMDLVAVSKEYDSDGNVVYGTGLAFEIPDGYVGLLFPRSSNAKKNLLLSNSVGVLDSGYRGEVTFKFKPSCVLGMEKYSVLPGAVDSYEIGDRIGQMIVLPYPRVEFEEVSELSESDRGTGGYGSTGK